VVDTVQTVGKIDQSAAPLFVDFLALSAHKFYGPKGVGALLLRKDLVLDPLVHGASQENGRRGGTHNVAGIVGMGAAAKHVLEDLKSDSPSAIAEKRDWLAAELERALGNGFQRMGGGPQQGSQVLPNTLNAAFTGVLSVDLAAELDRHGVCVSQGAACRSGAISPSHNIVAMGFSEAVASTTIRISLGRHTSREEVEYTRDKIVEAVRKLKK